MVAELSSMMEAAADDDYEEDDSGDEYDSQDSDAENCLNNSGGDWYWLIPYSSLTCSTDTGIDLSKLLDPGRDNNGYDEFLDDEEDPDALSDPLYSINLKQYLVSFLTDFIRQPCFQHFTPHLNMMEQKTLQQLANSS